MESTAITSLAVPLSLMVIMFGMGLSLSMDDFRRIVVSPRAVLVGSIVQILILPSTGFLCAILFGLTGETAVGLLILASCAGGVTSNMLSYLARGDIALSVSLTAISSCITIFTIPVFVNLGLSYFLSTVADIRLPVKQTIFSLMLVTVFPVLCGMLIRYRCSNFAQRTEPLIKAVSLAVLSMIIIGTILNSRKVAIESISSIGPATYALNVLCMVLGYFVARLCQLSDKQSTTIVIEIGVQNVVTAVFVAISLLHIPAMSVPAAIYSLPMFFNACIYVALKRRKLSRL